MSKLNNKTKLDWINNNPRIKKSISYHLSSGSEIPQMIFGHSPVAAEEAANFITTKMLPSDINSIVYKEKGLLSREVSFIRQRLDRVSKINLFDVAETSGDSSLPFIYELIENDLLYKYVPVTPNKDVNDLAIEKVKDFVTQAMLGKINYDSILADTETVDFKTQVINMSKEMEVNDFLNLFVLSGSRLGNSHKPERMLHNIYASMDEGDYLAIVQGLYRQGIEDLIVSDYQNIVDQEGSLMMQKIIAEELNPGGEHKVFWEDSANPGIRFGTNVQNSSSDIAKDLAQGQYINLFRSNRFKEVKLRDMILKAGFSFVDIAYDKNMDHGLFFLEK